MSQSESFDQELLEVGAESALEQIAQAGTDALKLVEAWVRHANAAAVQEIAERGSGPARKAARRGLNVLKARKVPIPDRPRKSSLLGASKSEPEAWMMPPDPAGVRLLALCRGVGGGVLVSSMIYLNDNLGVLRLENSETTPRKFRAALDKLLPKAGYSAVQVPLDWARYKIAQARIAHQRSQAPEPLGFTTAQALIAPVPETAPEHPFDAEGFEVAEDDAKELASDSGSLHHLPEFRAWLPSQAATQEVLSRVGQHFEPGEKPEQDRVSELLKEEMLAATDRYFTPEARAELIGRMKDAGLSVLARTGEADALKLAATMVVINGCGLVTNPPQEVPFLRAFFEKAVSVLMAQSGGKLSIPLPRPVDASGDETGSDETSSST